MSFRVHRKVILSRNEKLALNRCLYFLTGAFRFLRHEVSEPQAQTVETPGIDQSDAEYDNVKTWNWMPYETLYRTDGTRMGLVRDADGTRPIGEIPDTKV